MKNIKIFVIIVLFLSLYISTVSAGPIVESVVTNPINPKPLSTFTVIASIIGDNIISVNVTISECSDKTAQCYKSHQNIHMVLNDDGKYQANVTLTGTQDSIDHVQYLFVINDNGTYYNVSDLKTYLNLTKDNGNNTDGVNTGSPGFELGILLIAVFISLIFLKRKR